MRHAFALALLLLAAPAAGAATIVLDFEEEAAGFRGPSFVSAECNCVTLSDSPSGVELSIGSFEGSRVLFVGDEGGGLRLDFLVPITSLSIDFGGDREGDDIDIRAAFLQGFAGDLLVAFAELEPNRDRHVNQTITVSSLVPMDRAYFSLPQLGPSEPISPIVGGIRFETVPEPGTLGLGVLVSALLATARPRRPGSRPPNP